MFEHDYKVRGKHAEQIKFLAKCFECSPVYIDIYINAVIFGVFYNRQANEDKSSAETIELSFRTLKGERKEFIINLYRMTMLLDCSRQLTPKERINRAFHYNNFELFNSYMRGGLEYLYRQFKACTRREDCLKNTLEIMEKFKGDAENFRISALKDLNGN